MKENGKGSHSSESNVFPMVIDHEDRILYNEKKLDNIGYDIGRIHEVRFPEVRRDIAELKDIVQEQGERMASGLNRLGFLVLGIGLLEIWQLFFR